MDYNNMTPTELVEIEIQQREVTRKIERGGAVLFSLTHKKGPKLRHPAPCRATSTTRDIRR